MHSRKIEPLTSAYTRSECAPRVSARLAFNCRNRELAHTLAFIYDVQTSRYVTPDRKSNRTVCTRTRGNYGDTLSGEMARKKKEKGGRKGYLKSAWSASRLIYDAFAIISTSDTNGGRAGSVCAI